MKQVETSLDIAAPPMKVWRALCDFSAYPRWNPYRVIDGVAGLDEKVVLRIGSDPAKRRPVPARITAFEPGKLLVFKTGRPLLIYATETFELERSQRGTRLRHIARMSGVGAGLIGRLTFGPKLIAVYDRVDDALADYVAPGRQPKRRLRSDSATGPGGPKAANRAGGRHGQ